MARLAILGLLSLALLVSETSAQTGMNDTVNGTLVDDADYEWDNGTGYGYLDTTETTETTVLGEWIEPVIPPDANWTNLVCQRYRHGAV